MKDTKISVRIESSYLDKFRQAAKYSGMNFSDFVRLAVEKQITEFSIKGKPSTAKSA